MKSILIIGGAGFLGSNLSKRLSERNTHRIVISDSFKKAEKWNNLVRASIDEIVYPENLFDWLTNFGFHCEIIYYLGGISSTLEIDVNKILNSNYNFPLSIWRWCAANNVRFIYASSYEVYGNGYDGFDDIPNLEYQYRLRPLNPNGWSKKVHPTRH